MIRLFTGLLLVAALSPMTMAAEGSLLLGQSRDWSAYSATADDRQVCYALSQPHASEPRGAKRGPIYFLISDWPSRHAKGEAEIVTGYKYKDGATVTVDVGNQKFAFFTRNDGENGTAWLLSLADTQHLIDAMAHGSTALVTGTSARGTVTRDTYNLAGLDEALNKIHASCGM
jgi:hypothetical protein